MLLLLRAVSVALSTPTCASHGVHCVSGAGELRDSTLGLTEVVWVGPESQHIYVGSPSIWKMPRTGEIVASHDFFGDSTLNFTVQVFLDRSGVGDEGAVWEHAGNVSGMYWANLFTHPSPTRHAELYLLGVSDDDKHGATSIVIARSDDLGQTWSTPSILFPANVTAKRSYHCAPTPTLVAADGRLYRAFETFAHYSGAFLIGTVHAVEASTDLLSPATWQMTSTVTLNTTAMVPQSWDQEGKFGWQEGTAVQLRNGSVYNVLRIDGQTNRTHNVAALLRLEEKQTAVAALGGGGNGDGSSGRLVFDRMISFPATSSKFVVRADPRSQSLLSLSTDVSPEAVAIGAVGARNHLSLVVSKPASITEWEACAVLLVDDTGFAPADSARFTGFHYVDWIFDGADILYAIRTGYRGSNTYHNANRMTVKRVKNYSRLFDPITAACTWRSQYALVGEGWCRPSSGFVALGVRVSDMECAQRCTEAAGKGAAGCLSFANSASKGCSLYPSVATTSSGETGLLCYNKKI